MNNWQRVSPIALFYFVANDISVLVNNLIYTIPLVITSYNVVLDNPVWLILCIGGFIGLLGFSAFLQYYFFKFRLTEHTIEIKSGVFKKLHLNLPFTRIQNVKLIAPFYFRPFRYTTVELDTAGSAKSEAKIVALNDMLAQKLKSKILSQVSPRQRATPNDAAPRNIDEIVLNQRSLKDLIIHGITNNRIWIFFALLAPFMDAAAKKTNELLTSFGFNFSEVFSPATHAWWQLGLYALGVLMVSYLIVVLFSVFGSIIAFYGYTLSKQGKNYIRRSGLFTHHEVVMKLQRLQLVISQQDWLDILVKRINLRFEQTKSQQRSKPGHEVRNKIMVPSVTQQQFNSLILDVWPINALATIEFLPISKRFILRHILLLTPIATALIGASLYHQQWQLALIVVVSMTLLSLLIVIRWYRWGYAIDNNFMYVRKGLFGVNYYVFPIHKVQQTKYHQSLFMAHRKLASISLVLASGVQKVPFMPQQTAQQIIDKTLFIVESTKRSWM